MKPLANVGELKKTRLREGGTLTTKEAQDILAQKDAESQVACDKRENGNVLSKRQSTIRRCGTCSKPGHNTRTRQADVAMINVSSSD